MRPATFEPQQIIEAGLALQAEGRNITGFALRNRVGGGNPGRLKQVWDEYLSSLLRLRVSKSSTLAKLKSLRGNMPGAKKNCKIGLILN